MQQATRKNLILFIVFWLVLFVLYLPAAGAGFVADFTGWLHEIRTQGFWEYINRSHFAVKSLYQFTQLTTYIIYKAIGANAWGWHLIHVTLQTVNAYLLFLLCYKIFKDSGIEKAKIIAITGVLLFCINPYLSEVIVWEPTFHYLQGFLMMLLILRWVQQFHHTPKTIYAVAAAIVFLLSTYSLEIFYLTPVFTITLCIYYYIGLGYDKKLFRKTLLWFFLPQVILFIAHLTVYYAVYGEWIPHLKDQALEHSLVYYLSKPAKYFFQLAFVGRYLPTEVKVKAYALCESSKGIGLMLVCIIAITAVILFRFKKMKPAFKAASLLYIWILPTLFIMGPLWFAEAQPYVFCDRYLYVLSALVYMLGCLLLSTISNRYIFWCLALLYGIANLFITIKVNRYWHKSSNIIYTLLNDIPITDRTIILLNTPENLRGIPMMDATPDGEYKLMHNEFATPKITNVVYDAMAFNMQHENEGAHVAVMNDSTIGVTLNQWGTWWWYNAQGGISYENDDYSIDMKDMGHYYELTLKRPASNYLLLYMTNGHWEKVNWNLKTSPQY